MKPMHFQICRKVRLLHICSLAAFLAAYDLRWIFPLDGRLKRYGHLRRIFREAMEDETEIKGSHSPFDLLNEVD